MHEKKVKRKWKFFLFNFFNIQELNAILRRLAITFARTHEPVGLIEDRFETIVAL